MININFTEKELEILQEYFQSELYKAEQKIDNIKGILGKIGKKRGKMKPVENHQTKRGRNKGVVLASLLPKQDFEPKRRGRKPKSVKQTEMIVTAPTQKKRGRPAKIKTDNLLSNEKSLNKKLPAQPVTTVAAKKTSKNSTAVSVSGIEKRRPGRPRKYPEVDVAEKKTKVGKTDNKGLKSSDNKQHSQNISVQKARKKETRAPKIPWGDWILAVLRESDSNLSQDQIFTAVSKKLRLSAEDFKAAESKLKDHMLKLLKSKRIIAGSEKPHSLYSIKITGKGIH